MFFDLSFGPLKMEVAQSQRCIQTYLGQQWGLNLVVTTMHMEDWGYMWHGLPNCPTLVLLVLKPLSTTLLLTGVEFA